jgi:hypothetical protein
MQILRCRGDIGEDRRSPTITPCAGDERIAGNLHRVTVLIVQRPLFGPEADLLLIVDAADALRPRLGFGQCREEHGRQNRDDRDDDEQFNKGERPVILAKCFHCFCYCWVYLFGEQSANSNDLASTVNPFQPDI